MLQSACSAIPGNKTLEIQAAVFRSALGMLRFLYSGWLEAHGETLLLSWTHWTHWTFSEVRSPEPLLAFWPPRIEVGLLADKYQVDELQKAASWMGDGRRG